MMIDGNDLQSWGFKPGPHFKAMITEANRLKGQGRSQVEIIEQIRLLLPAEIETMELRTNNIPFGLFLDVENELERMNRNAVVQHMDALMRVPTIVAGAVMPDACPAGTQMGTIPVGGVIAAKDAIHPGMHSADICCSMAITIFNRDMDLKTLLDAAQSVTHFGPGGRAKMVEPPEFLKSFDSNPFLKGLENMALSHLGSQGDGNHFAYVGYLESNGKPALVTHHGSRGFGAALYKRGMEIAKKHTRIVASGVPPHNAWIKADSRDGENYWQALQMVRLWTRANHFILHDMVQRKVGNMPWSRYWNEHNFVFQKSDGLFYHGKGATPNWRGFSDDDSGLTLIPMNCSEPILISRHVDSKHALGFAPHGAGRNFSRTQHLRNGDALHEELAALQSKGLDIRSYCGTPDLSELPSAYKNAAAVQAQIEKYHLGAIVDRVMPYGSIMAGDWERDMPWRKAKT
jgi:RNA-splicing ligase RtcB